MKTYEQCFHGTLFKYARSIVKTGLKKSGSKDADGNLIGVREDHIDEGSELANIKNWSAAIFVSPSIFYSSDSVYAETLKNTSRGDF